MKNTIRLAAVLLATTVSPVSAESDLRMGERLYQENCASCHGANLEGQPDWRTRLPNGRLPAPPHDASGHTWHHTDRVLFDIVKRGPAAIVGAGYESDMPGYEGVLTDDEITSIVDYIKSTWPDKERAFQSERTREDQQAKP
ncbi:MAG: c-type cytochrome [Paracoccaceae bacterium]|jgi:mono/diheme cytochrome c family protein|uniref:Cytochrome bc1 complex cytochrome c subunit n=3 Tax=Alphaproteobacteria TaxID=28211 RepID=A0A1V0RVG7_9RHOB|nr:MULTISPECIES: c-type cytochrome [Roseobacteraceae]MBC7284723.1 cytochrome c [Hoeflea sp.]MDF1710435.1 c-type cytochrome [Paracoccaceae bacterium]PKQ11508.1 MAG: cytochrome C [Alphaproteobacteria bacterium HGW-Alphaproteobacteria-1]ARE85582.1 cytochrome bc1 complex cytochrome c subunit [Roseovarius mucosus]KGM86149.1 Cytochrome c, mono- and diheme variant [Roseovarius mucosus DSM 17069]|tara:strand:+ start:8159 stop:8584 length:426 start_codon:yes stop_codon:yes gene_type:complete